MAEKIITAFQTGKPVKIESMSWSDFLSMLEQLGSSHQTTLREQ
ncbi:hypothetical protein [Vibrio azureus]|nr:hypothetical protein [Vibrio azureus]